MVLGPPFWLRASTPRLACLARASLVSLCLLGCGSESGAGASSIFAVPADIAALHEETFFDQPFPSDLRIEGGAPRYAGYPNPRKSALLADYISRIGPLLDGFSPAAAGYLRFTAPLDPASLPSSPPETLSPESSVQLIDVDPASPERGQRNLIALHLRPQGGVYWATNTLAFMPALGFPLRPATRYALVVTKRAMAADGGGVRPAAELEELLGVAEPTSAARASARDAFAVSVAEIERAGVSRTEIAHMTVFTTADPARELFVARDVLRQTFPAPIAHIEDWRRVTKEGAEHHDEYVGVYGPSPNFQEGTPPYSRYADGGAFAVDGSGRPRVTGSFDARFSLSVPRASQCPMPDAGYPIVLYAHGTGGDYRSYVRERIGENLGERCIATMGVDQIFHGTRPGTPKDGNVGLAFFNLSNVYAARANARQSALDEVQRARLFTETQIQVPAFASATAAPIRFDPNRVLYFGHSQGGLNGPLYLAADDTSRAAVFSGASSVMAITLLEKTEPAPNVAELVRSIFLDLSHDEYEELNIFHPAMSLAQSIVDVVDPIHYARYIARSPRSGFAPKSALVTEGINPDGTGDRFAPPRGIEAHAIAMGLPLLLPAQRDVPEAHYGGPPPTAVPPEGLQGNLAGGRASGALVQWAVPPGSDGHFVVFDVPAARVQAADFLKYAADEDAGRVPPP